jgi:transcription termination factor NusB
MDIHQRINARKLMLSYVYHYCFLAKLASSVERATQEKAEFPTSEQRDPFFDQYFLADLKMLWEQEAKAGERTQQKIASLLSEANEEEIPYYLKYFFDQWQESDVDMEYCVKIGSVFSSYVSEMERAVDTYTESFNYQQMDAIDQAIFLL